MEAIIFTTYSCNTLNLSIGAYSPHNFEIGDLQQEEMI